MPMTTAVATSVAVRYRTVAGWHVFDSHDIRGLYVASHDLARAYQDIPASIRTILRLSTGQDWEVKMEIPVADFMQRLKADQEPPVSAGAMEWALRGTRFQIAPTGR
jgi:hypothetical protein